MPRLRRLTGKEVLKILGGFGFEIHSQKRSHIKLQRITEAGEKQRILVAVHGSKTIRPGTLKSIYRKASSYIDEDDLRSHFYAD